MLNFRAKTFLCACKHMNFTNAAAELGISQPAVSQHIRRLEEDYGVKLFSYEGKRLRLTPEGQLVLNAVQTMNNDEHILRQRIGAMQTNRQMYCFGATHTIAGYMIAGRLAPFLRNNPDCNMHIYIADTEKLLKDIDEGQIDFAIVEGFFDHSRYETLPFSTETLLCVCGPAYDIPDEVSTEMLFRHRLIAREKGAGARELLDRALATINCSVDSFASHVIVGMPRVMKELTMQNCGLAFLFESAVKEELRTGRLRRVKVKNLEPTYSFTFLWKSSSMYREDFLRMYRQLSGRDAPDGFVPPLRKGEPS